MNTSAIHPSLAKADTDSAMALSKKRTHPDLNWGPIDLQSIALPLSYKSLKLSLSHPRVELGSNAWKASIILTNLGLKTQNLPLDQRPLR